MYGFFPLILAPAAAYYAYSKWGATDTVESLQQEMNDAAGRGDYAAMNAAKSKQDTLLAQQVTFAPHIPQPPNAGVGNIGTAAPPGHGGPPMVIGAGPPQVRGAGPNPWAIGGVAFAGLAIVGLLFAGTKRKKTQRRRR